MSAPAGANWAEPFFDGLLRAYPAAFREEYTVEMRAAFRDRLRDVRATGGWPGLRTSVAGMAALLLAAALLACPVQPPRRRRPGRPVGFAIAGLTLLAAALLACWLPARHIARIDPMLLLRSD